LSESPLSNHSYLKLFSAQVIALLGAGLTTVALTLLAYEIAGGSAGALLGKVLAIKMFAYVFFAPIVGGIAHRFNRKALMITLDILRALIVVSLPFVTAVWQVYLLIFLLSLFSAGFKPVYQSTIPDILPDEEQYTRALSYSRLAYDLETLLSPMLAGLLLIVMTYDALFLGNFVAFMVSAILVASTRLPPREPVNRLGGLGAEITFGVRAYFKTPRLRAMFSLYLGVAAASAMVIVNTVVYVRDYLRAGDSEVALALAASGAGSMLAAVCVPKLVTVTTVRTIMLSGSLILALGLVPMTIGPSLSGLMIMWLVVGLGWSLVQTPAGQVVNRSSSVPDRDAYYSAQFALSHACWLVMYPLIGYLGDTIGLEATAGWLSGLVVVSATVGYLLWPEPDPAIIEHTHDPVAHSHRHRHDDHHEHGHQDEDHHHIHKPVTHAHEFVIDDHHPTWPV
jgi:MFS family permease